MPEKTTKMRTQSTSKQKNAPTKTKSSTTLMPAVKSPPKVRTPKIKDTHPGEFHRMVSETAYFIAERRGFCGGNCKEDWYEAERVVLKSLK